MSVSYGWFAVTYKKQQIHHQGIHYDVCMYGPSALRKIDFFIDTSNLDTVAVRCNICYSVI